MNNPDPSSKIKLSVAMITFNEEHNVRAAIESVNWADQIVVVDNKSTDYTAEIVKESGVELYFEENVGNLNINKNKSIEYCRGDWILVLDADERIPYDLAGEIRTIINSNTSYNGYYLARKNYVLGKWIKRGSQFPDYQLRLFRRGKGKFPAVHIHEKLTIEGKIGKLNIPFEHYPYPNIDSMLRKNRRDVEFEAQYLFKQQKNISAFGLIATILFKAPIRFLRRYFLKGGCLDGVQGVIIVWFDVMNQVLRKIRLWELQKEADRGN